MNDETSNFIDRLLEKYPLETIKSVLNKDSFETDDGHLVSIVKEHTEESFTLMPGEY